MPKDPGTKYKIEADMVDADDAIVQRSAKMHGLQIYVKEVFGPAGGNPVVEAIGQPAALVEFFSELGYNNVEFDLKERTGEAY